MSNRLVDPTLNGKFVLDELVVHLFLVSIPYSDTLVWSDHNGWQNTEHFGEHRADGLQRLLGPASDVSTQRNHEVEDIRPREDVESGDGPRKGDR